MFESLDFNERSAIGEGGIRNFLKDMRRKVARIKEDPSLKVNVSIAELLDLIQVTHSEISKEAFIRSRESKYFVKMIVDQRYASCRTSQVPIISKGTTHTGADDMI